MNLFSKYIHFQNESIFEMDSFGKYIYSGSGIVLKINEWITDGGYPGQITILSMEKKEDSCVNLLDRNLIR